MRVKVTILLCFIIFLWGYEQVLAAQEEPRSMTLAYSGNLDGELEPCGCSLEGNLGGILRQISTIDQWREVSQDLFLISSGGLILSETPHDKTTGEYILKGYEQMAFDAVGVQWPDRAYGDDFIAQFTLPWVSTNSRGPFEPRKEVERGGNKLAIYSWLDPGLMDNMAGKLALADQSQALGVMREGLKQAKQDKMTTVLLSTLSLEQAQQQLPLEHVDVLLVKSSYEVYGEPVLAGKTLVLQPGSRGMRFGRIDAKVDAAGSILSYEHTVKSMPPEVPDAARMLDWYQSYTDKLKEEYMASVALKKKLVSQGSPYAGAKTCQTCHEAAYAAWQDSKHAKAFRTLTKVNKAFDSACVKCHTVGFGKPGGFIDNELTRDLANVQCESCHGAAAEHVQSGGVKSVANLSWVGEKMCAQCHVQKHSPSFQFDTYWPKIQH